MSGWRGIATPLPLMGRESQWGATRTGRAFTGMVPHAAPAGSPPSLSLPHAGGGKHQARQLSGGMA